MTRYYCDRCDRETETERNGLEVHHNYYVKDPLVKVIGNNGIKTNWCDGCIEEIAKVLVDGKVFTHK